MLLERIENEGFAIEAGVLREDDLKLLISHLKRAALPRSRAGVRHAMRHTSVANLARDPKLLEMAQEVLGPDALPFRATLFDKSAASNWLVAWHQDTALPLRERTDVVGWGPWSIKEGVTYAHAPAKALCQVLALRVHLDDSTAENGPLRVLPGTHTHGVLTDEEMLELACKEVAIECVIPRGGVLAMRPLLVHASSKSRSEMPRRVLHIEYAAQRILADNLELAIA